MITWKNMDEILFNIKVIQNIVKSHLQDLLDFSELMIELA